MTIEEEEDTTLDAATTAAKDEATIAKDSPSTRGGDMKTKAVTQITREVLDILGDGEEAEAGEDTIPIEEVVVEAAITTEKVTAVIAIEIIPIQDPQGTIQTEVDTDETGIIRTGDLSRTSGAMVRSLAADRITVTKGVKKGRIHLTDSTLGSHFFANKSYVRRAVLLESETYCIFY